MASSGSTTNESEQSEQLGASAESADLAALRPVLHGMWASVAGSWGERAGFVDERGEVVTAAMLDLAAPAAGARVLDLASGPGGAGLAAARLVGPTGSVVLSDVAAPMVAIAASRAEAAQLGNVEARLLDLEQIDEPDESYDVVLCREGLMLVPAPNTAAREMHRVVRPGGRVAVAVWGPAERNPWLAALLEAVGAELGMEVPPPGIPGPFSMSDRVALGAVLEQAGFAEVAVREVDAPWHARSFDDWWSMVPTLAGPVSQVLASLPDDARWAVRARAATALAPFATDDGLVVPGLSLVAGGRR